MIITELNIRRHRFYTRPYERRPWQAVGIRDKQYATCNFICLIAVKRRDEGGKKNGKTKTKCHVSIT